MKISFLDCEIDVAAFALRRKERPIKIEPRVFDVLLYLIERRDRVVTKNELLDALWPGEAVSDSVLPRCIAAARRAVGDTRTRQKVIQTVHGRGYRFVAPVESAATSEAGADRRDEPRPRDRSSGVDPTSATSRFVGRSVAIRRLSEQLDRARGGHGSIALVVGEPGIGKTRLWQELAARAADEGCCVLVGRCFEGEGAPAYWPWIQILRDSIRATPDGMSSPGGAGVPAELAALVPEIAERSDATAPAAGPEGAQARFRLYDAATRHLGQLAADAPLVVVLDDLHWADASSLGLLRFLAPAVARLPILVVGTYRDVDVRRGHPLAEVLGALAREADTERVALGGFDASEIEAFVESESGQPPRAEVAHRLSEMTDGNPFFLREVVKLLAEDHDLSAVSADALHTLALPQGVRDVVGRRLSALSDECNQLLRAASVLGRSFASGVLRTVLECEDDESDERYLEWLAEALDAGAIVETGRGHYAFVHALTRQTLYEELSAPQRILLHRRAVGALELALRPDAPGRLAELAHHAFEAAPGGDVDRAIEYAVAAAEAAHGQCAYDEARHQYERALEALELLVPPPVDRRLELMLRAAEERYTAGDRSRGQEQLVALAGKAREANRPDLVARAAIAIFGYGEMGYPHPPEHVSLLEEAISVTEDSEPALRARALSRLCGTVLDSMSRRRELAEASIALARESDDWVAEQDAWSAAWWASLGPDRVEHRFEIADALETLAARSADPTTLLLCLESRLGAYLLLADGVAAAAAIDRYQAVAAELRMPVFIFLGMMLRVSLLMNAGELDRADALRDEALEYGRGRIAFAPLAAAGQLQWSILQRRETGGAPARVEGLDRALRNYFADRHVADIFAATMARGPERRTGLTGEALRSIPYRTLERDEHWLLAIGAATDAAYDLADKDVMAELYDLLWPYRDLMVVHDLSRMVSGAVWACLGELATGLGRLDDAVDHFQAAVDKEASGGFRPAALTSRAGLARACLLRREPGDADRARALVAEIDRETATAEYGVSSDLREELEALLGS